MDSTPIQRQILISLSLINITRLPEEKQTYKAPEKEVIDDRHRNKNQKRYESLQLSLYYFLTKRKRTMALFTPNNPIFPIISNKISIQSTAANNQNIQTNEIPQKLKGKHIVESFRCNHITLLRLQQTLAQKASNEPQYNQQRKHPHQSHICQQGDGRLGQIKESCLMAIEEGLPSHHSRVP